MASERPTNPVTQPTGAEGELRGGIEGGDPDRYLDPNNKKPGNPGMASPSGGDKVPPPSKAIPNTDIAREPGRHP